MMKYFLNLFLLLLLFSIAASAQNQWIDSITLQPSNPDADDTIKFYVAVSFSSGSCDQHSQLHILNGNTIEASALHCTGMLAYICSHTDTFVVTPLSAGNYTFRFNLTSGDLPFPCSSLGIPAATDSLQFLVSPVSNILQPDASPILIYINETGNLRIDGLQAGNLYRAEIFSVDGKLLISEKLSGVENIIRTSIFSAGVYFFRVHDKNGMQLANGKFVRR